MSLMILRKPSTFNPLDATHWNPFSSRRTQVVTLARRHVQLPPKPTRPSLPQGLTEGPAAAAPPAPRAASQRLQVATAAEPRAAPVSSVPQRQHGSSSDPHQVLSAEGRRTRSMGGVLVEMACRTGRPAAAMLLMLVVSCVYWLLWTTNLRVPPLASWPVITATALLPHDSLFRASPILATGTSLVASISGVNLLHRSGVFVFFARRLARLPPPPKALPNLAAATLLAPVGAAVIQHSLLEGFAPLLAARRRERGGAGLDRWENRWGHPSPSPSVYRHGLVWVWGGGGCVLAWLWATEVVLCAEVLVGGAGRRGQRGRELVSMCHKLMTAQLTLLTAVHLGFLSESFPAAETAPSPASPPAAPQVPFGQAPPMASNVIRVAALDYHTFIWQYAFNA